MAGRYLKWPMLVASAGATMALMVATARLIPGGPIRVASMAIPQAGTPNVGSALVEAAEAALKRDRYVEAERLAREALAVREKVLGPEHLALVQPLRILSFSLTDRELLDEAEKPARRALAILERYPGPSHSDRITMLGHLAFLSAKNGDRASSDEMSRQALALAEAFPGFHEEDLVDALNNRGGFLTEIEKRHAEAGKLFERALAILERDQGADLCTLAMLLGNVGEIHSRLGRYAEAERYFLRARSIQEREPGVSGRDRITALCNLNILYCRQGRLDEAEVVLRQARSTAEATWGPDDPSLVAMGFRLARVLAGKSQFEEVETLTRRALALAAKVFEPESVDMGEALYNSAVILRDIGYSNEAVSLLERTLAIAEKVAGPDQPGVAQLLEELAKTHDVRGVPADSEAALLRAIAIREKIGPEDEGEDELTKDLSTLARHYAVQRRIAEAEPLARKVVSNTEKDSGPDSPNLVYPLHLLAGIAQDLGHGPEAESLAKRALAIAEKDPEGDIRARMTCLSYLSQIYSRQGRADEARVLDRRRHALQVEDAAKYGLVEVEGGGFTISPYATQAQKDAWASKLSKETGFPMVIGQAEAGEPRPKFPTDVIGGEALGLGWWQEFSTPHVVGKAKLEDGSDLLFVFPAFPADIDVKKTSGIDPKPVVPPTQPK